MGTSSRYEGKKRSRLVPDSFDDIKIDDLELQEQNDTLDNEADASLEENNLENDKRDDLNEEIQSTGYAEYPWKAVKSYMSNFASRRKGYNLKQLLSNYVKAYGGSTNAARTSKIAVITTIKIGAFFTSVSNKSIEQVLSENGIQIKHRTAKEILSDVVNFLAPMPDTKENAVARKALISTMSLVYEKLENENTDISVLNLIDQKFTEKLITEYFISFIYENLIHDLGNCIETKAENSLNAALIEREMNDYVRAKVSTTLKNKALSIINSNTENVSILVESLYEQCYKVMEDQL